MMSPPNMRRAIFRDTKLYWNGVSAVPSSYRAERFSRPDPYPTEKSPRLALNHWGCKGYYGWVC
jgi:hypothetical protein